MKKLLFIFLAITSFASAQIAETAEDISPLLIGEKIPKQDLVSVDEKLVSTSDIFHKKTVLIVYRGGWCPYCNLHLAALGQAEKELLDLGYQIIAVSPDAPKNLKITDEKEKLNYLLLSDSDGALAKAVGIAFQAPDGYKQYVSNGSNGINNSFLPVPTVFIVNTNTEIQFEHITPDFKHRISNDLLIAAAKALK